MWGEAVCYQVLLHNAASVVCLFIVTASLGSQDKKPSELFGPLQETFLDGAQRLTLYHGRPSSDPIPDPEMLYGTSEVNELFANVRHEILKRVPEDDIPLQTYVNRVFPLVLNDDQYLPQSKVEGYIRRVETLLNKLASLSAFRLDLTVNSNPSGARFELIPFSGTHLAITTNDRLTNVYRGQYDYEVKKTGYKTIHEQINFVDRSGDELNCELQPVSIPRDPIPCRLK